MVAGIGVVQAIDRGQRDHRGNPSKPLVLPALDDERAGLGDVARIEVLARIRVVQAVHRSVLGERLRELVGIRLALGAGLRRLGSGDLLVSHAAARQIDVGDLALEGIAQRDVVEDDSRGARPLVGDRVARLRDVRNGPARVLDDGHVPRARPARPDRQRANGGHGTCGDAVGLGDRDHVVGPTRADGGRMPQELGGTAPGVPGAVADHVLAVLDRGARGRQRGVVEIRVRARVEPGVRGARRRRARREVRLLLQVVALVLLVFQGQGPRGGEHPGERQRKGEAGGHHRRGAAAAGKRPALLRRLIHA